MIIAVVGPTGVGKTKLSIALAKKYNAPIINFDSIQIYKGLNIGSAKVTKEEMENIPHYMLDIKEVSENYSVADYQKDARKILNDLLNENKNVVLVGGTGLYLKALLYDYQFNLELKNNYDNYTNQELYDLVLKKDPSSQLHINNRPRLIRYLINLDNNTDINQGNNILYKDVCFIGLTTDRDNLYNKINDRVIKMFNEGLLEEVKYFYNQNLRTKPLILGIGYKELYDYLDGMTSIEEAITLIQKRSRNYAKRQYTWFKNQVPVTWFNTNYEDFDKTINEVTKFLDEK